MGTEQFLAQHVRLKTPEVRASSFSQTIPLSAPVFVQQAFIRYLLYARPGSELCRCSSVRQALLLWSAVLGERGHGHPRASSSAHRSSLRSDHAPGHLGPSHYCGQVRYHPVHPHSHALGLCYAPFMGEENEEPYS